MQWTIHTSIRIFSASPMRASSSEEAATDDGGPATAQDNRIVLAAQDYAPDSRQNGSNAYRLAQG